MEFIIAARILRALSVRRVNTQPKRFTGSTALGAALTLVLLGPLAMPDAHALYIPPTPQTGTIAGSAAVSATGAASYTIPINLPAGTNGMQPSLSLAYDSQSSDGWAGYGWTLSGLSAITRCPANPEDDGINYNIPIKYSTTSSYSDDFCLDGQRLRLISGAYYGVNGATYGKEIEDFSVITSHTTGSGGPTYFTVQTKDGRTYEYGNTSDSSIVANNSAPVVRTWALDKVTDGNGNYISYKYASASPAGTEYWPVSISYTGNGSTAPDHVIQFDFEAKAAMVMGAYTAGSFSQVSQMLQDIKITYAGATTWAYYLNYNTDGGGGRDLLSSVKECSGAGMGTANCFPATTIAWNPSAAGWQSKVNTGITVVNLGRAKAAKLMDVDGDGIEDLVFPGSTWYVAFGQPGGGFGTPANTGIAVSAPSTYFGNALAIDYNGDGCMDLIVPSSSGTWTVMISQCTQTGTIFSTSPDNNTIPAFSSDNTQTGTPIFEGNLSVGSFRGNGITDIFDNTGNYLQLRRNYAPPNDGAISGWINLISISGNDIEAPGFVDTGLDFDGSGRAGMLAYLSSGSWAAYVPAGDSTVTQMDTQAGNANPAIPFDMNGDGLTDLLSNSAANQWQITLSTGTGFKNLLYNLYNDDTNADPILADYYGNGTKVAIVYAGSSSGTSWYILHPTSNGAGGYSVSSTALSHGIYPYNSNYGTGTLRVGSISSYGQDDLVYALNNGDNTFNFYYQLHNFTAGEYPDVVNTITDGLGNVTQFAYNTLSDGSPTYSMNVTAAYPIHGVQKPMPVVTSMAATDSNGASYHLSYTYANAEVDTDGHGFLGFGSRMVTDSRNGNKETITYDQAFPFTGMVTDDLLQKSSGDKIMETVSTGADQLSLPTGGFSSQRYFPFFDSTIQTDYDFVGGTVQPVRATASTLSTASFDAYGNVLSSATTVTDDTQSGDPTYTTTTATTYAPQGTSYCADMPLTVVITESRSSPSESASRNISYTDDTNHCRVQSRTLAPGTSTGGSPAVATSYPSFDAFGNATEVDVSTPGATTPLRKTTYSFTGGNNEFPTAKTDTVSSTKTLSSNGTWDYSLGVSLSSTDPNGNTTSMAYDGFGRLITITRPDGSGSGIAYGLCPGAGSAYCPAGAAYETTSSTFNNLTGAGYSSITTGYTAYDSWGRAIEHGKVLFGGGKTRVDTAYDGLGDVVSQSKPFLGSAPVYSMTYTYDLALRRIKEISEPQNAADPCSGSAPTPCNKNISFSYSGFTTTVSQSVTDSASSSSTQTTVAIKDALSETLSAQDSNGGVTTYGYDAFGDLISTQDPSGNLMTIGYDGLGRKTSMVDPNMGSWTYQVDALGEVTCQTDAKLQSTVFAYDGIGRIDTKTETSAADCALQHPDVVYTGTWTYDSAAHGQGLPASVTDSNGFARSYDYDPSSRPLDVTTTVTPPGGSATNYAMTTGYDNFGRVANLTYPSTGVTGVSRFGVTYNYDAASGALSSVSDTATSLVYWQVATGAAPVDAFGHVLGYVDGNGVDSVSTYDSATGAVTAIGTTTPASLAAFDAQQLQYSWDGFGNLVQRCDANRGLTEGFTYDGLNRLLTSQVYSGGSTGTCSASTKGAYMALTYDAVGNIKTRSNTGLGITADSYSYGGTNGGPNALTSISGTTAASYAYDADGNMVCRDSVGTSCAGTSPATNITWNGDNLPVAITAGGNTSSFSYGPDLQRYQQSATVAGNTVNTTYVGGLFEVVTASGDTQYRHNIMAYGAIVAVHTIDQSAAVTNTYVHSDDLDSADVLTNDAGTIAVDPATGQLQQMSFDAFGLRRNPADWSYNLTPVNVPGLKAFTDKGYTSQEQLDNVALVHMNGRVYDPGVGRFISADPMVPGDRYAYLGNNPLNTTDPSGYCCSLGDLNPFNPSSPLNPVTGPINVVKQGASAAKQGLKDLGDASRDIAEDSFKLGVAGFNMQREVASDYTRDIKDLIAAYTKGVKTWTRNSINFALHPAMNVEYSLPGVGNFLNVRFDHSRTLQRDVGDVVFVAAIVVDCWTDGAATPLTSGIYASYESYVADLNGAPPIQIAITGGFAYMTAYADGSAANSVWQGAEAFYGGSVNSDFTGTQVGYHGSQGFFTSVWNGGNAAFDNAMISPTEGLGFIGNHVVELESDKIMHGFGFSQAAISDTQTGYSFAASFSWGSN